MNSLSGKRAAVTGGGTGIGRATAMALAAEGAAVALLGRTPSTLEAVAEEIGRAGGVALPVPCDVRSTASVEHAVTACLDRLGGLDILVNAAGISGGGETRQQSDLLWNEILDTNLSGALRMIRQVLHQSRMLERGWGRIINIASTGGKQGVVHAAAYTASKHGLVGLTKSVGLELAKTGVTVNAVCPGFVETGMASHVREAYARIHQVSAEEMKRRIEARIPIGRYIQPGEVAAVVCFLASAATAGITAQAWNVCGGLGNY
jgi:ketoreductase